MQQLPVHGAAGQDELTDQTTLSREIEMPVANPTTLVDLAIPNVEK